MREAEDKAARRGRNEVGGMPAVVGAVRQRAARAFEAESDRWLVAILGGVIAAAVADDVERGDLLAGRP